MSSDQPPFSESTIAQIRYQLAGWYREHAREMPWRKSDNPYHIWLSEIMLQQTRVDQARPYFERFIRAFPSVTDLAEAPLDEVLLNWEGLGYYSRARNLHKAAALIVTRYNGVVPDDYEALISLPGVGPYTAAAVLSIAYARPFGVLDGNVVRVLTRLTCTEGDASKSKTRGFLLSLSNALVAPDNPGDFNQALMELGATVCTPQNPQCPACVIRAHCCAFAAGAMESFPVVKKKAPIPHYNIAVAIIQNKKKELLIQRRHEDDMLGGLWQFPGGKQEENEPLTTTCHREMLDELAIHISINGSFFTLSHAYTHFKITLHAFLCQIASGEPTAKSGTPLRWVALDELDRFAFSRSNRRLVEQLLLKQNTPDLFAE